MLKSFKLLTALAITAFLTATTISPAFAQTTKVMWGKTELKLGQSGRVTVIKPTKLYTIGKDNSLSESRTVNKGEEFRVYQYKNQNGGLYGLGGGLFVKKDSNIKYETPSKSKLDLVKNGASESYYGEWIINKVQAYGVGTYSSEDAESLLGKSLTFTANKANYFGDQPSDIEKVATNPIYTETIISESDFVANYRIPVDLLGIKAPTITEINVSDSNGHVSTLIIKDDNTLIISGGGTYFELIRKISKNQ